MKNSYIFYTDKLDREYLAVFEQIEMYVQSQNVDDDTKEERLGELLDIFLSAAERGDPVQKITGSDLEQFCKTFCSDFGVKTRLMFVLDWMRSIAKVMIFVSVLDLVFPEPDVMPGRDVSVWRHFSSLNISGYFIGIFVAGMVAMILNIVLRRIMFRRKRISMKVLKVVSAAGAVLGFVIIYGFLGANSINVIECPVWLVLGASCVYLGFYHVFRGRHIKREKVKFLDLVQEESRKEFPKEMEKKYEKARKKNLKKGKGELTLEAFLVKEEKSCDREEKMGLFYYILPLIVIASAFLSTWKMDGFDDGADAMIFVVINIVIQYTLMMGIWKICKVGIKERRDWVREKREEINREKDDEIWPLK